MSSQTKIRRLFYFPLSLAFVLFLFNTKILAQDVLVTSPEVANLGQYGSTQVGEYTGKPEISVPLYTIKSGKIEFPINLYYDATGIRVDQEATWVGLGWQLSTTAAINYTPQGKSAQLSAYYSDEYTAVGPSTSWWEEFYPALINNLREQSLPYPAYGGVMDQPYAGHPVDIAIEWESETPQNFCFPELSESQIHSFQNQFIASSALNGENQVDYFQINCHGLSGNFYIDPLSGEIMAYGEKNKYKITMYDNRQGFEITNEVGIVYTFHQVEYTAERITSSWYLNSIKDLNGAHWVQFHYSQFGDISLKRTPREVLYSGRFWDHYTSGFSLGGFSGVVSPLYLTEIETDMETISFHVNDSRDDLDGNGKRRLDSITIKDKHSNHTVKGFEFSYDYFNGTGIGGDYYHEDPPFGYTITPEHFKKRLKLLSVTERGYTDGVESDDASKAYSFEYNSTPLPYKTSFAKDFWGFYNGESNTTFIPNLAALLGINKYWRQNFLNNANIDGTPIFELYFGSDYNFIDGAHRSADKEAMKAGVLTAISYPTKGRTEFSYEPHTFTNQTILSAEEEKEIRNASNNVYISYSDNGHTEIVTNTTGTTSSTSPTFILDKRTRVTFKVSMNDHGGDFASDMIGSANVKLTRFRPDTKVIRAATYNPGDDNPDSFEEDFYLDPGVYYIYASAGNAEQGSSYDPVLAFAKVSYLGLSAIEHVFEDHSESIGGGLRIAEITNYDNDGQFIGKRKYSYDGGYLNSELAMGRHYSYVSSCDFSFRINYVNVRNINSLRNISIVPVGATVSYDKVTIEDIDSEGHNNGKVQKYFRNSSFSTPDHVDYNNKYKYFVHASDEALLNGKTDSILYFDTNDILLKKEVFDYGIGEIDANYINIFSLLKKHHVDQLTTCENDESDGCFLIPEIVVYTYPYKGFKSFLEKKQVIKYSEGGEMNQTIAFKYNMDNYLPKEQTTISSLEEIIKTSYLYPGDFSGEALMDSLVEQNRIGLPIETTVSKNASDEWLVISDQKIVYAQDANSSQLILPRYVYQKQGETLGSPPSHDDKQITYSEYDDKGNPLEIGKANGNRISYIWGYNGSLPVAKLENALYDSIPSSTIASIQAKSDLDDDHCQGISGCDEANLRNALNGLRKISALSNAMITTYTYDPLVGVTSQTDPNGLTIYYEYDSFGRLSQVKDYEGNILKEYTYNYKD